MWTRSQAKPPALQVTNGIDATHFSKPSPESTVQWPDEVMLELSTLNVPEKGGKTKTDKSKTSH